MVYRHAPKKRIDWRRLLTDEERGEIAFAEATHALARHMRIRKDKIIQGATERHTHAGLALPYTQAGDAEDGITTASVDQIMAAVTRTLATYKWPDCLAAAFGDPANATTMATAVSIAAVSHGVEHGWTSGAAAKAEQVVLPDEMTPAIEDALSFMLWHCASLSAAYRAIGFEIPHKAEKEQAFVIWKNLHFAVRHGDEWRTVAQAELNTHRDRQKTEAANG